MHPLASQTNCRGKIIDAHTIQRKGPLQKITSESNHVCQIDTSLDGDPVKDVGWRNASTFPGYCAEHDNHVFGVLEQVPFSGTHEQCVLQAYRSVCNELYRKRALLESLAFQRDIIDRGRNINEQISTQLSIAQNIAGQTKSMQELEQLWRKFGDAVTGGEYGHFASTCYFFDGDLCVTSSGTLHTEFDFHGNVLMDMWDLQLDAEMLSHSIMATDSGGAIVFTWLTAAETAASVLRSFDKLPNEDKGDIFIQYCFLNCENTYFSRAWWDGLDNARRQQLKMYSGALFYDGGSFIPNQSRLVGWTFDGT